MDAWKNPMYALGAARTNTQREQSQCYAFRTPPEFAWRLQEAGFDAMSQANNHANDFGARGLVQTTAALQAAGMVGTGWQGSRPAIVERQGRRLCLLAFAPNRGMNDLRDIAGSAGMVRQARSACDLVVVSFHGGAEGSDKARTPKGTETYLGENRGNLRAFARAMIDAGAGLVFGHGPHVPRGMELYRGHLVAYSLGNFMTYGGMSVTGVLGQAPLLLARVDSRGRLLSGRIVSFRQSPSAPVALDPQQRVAQTMMAATRADFEGGNLAFTEDGGFRPAR